MRNTYVLVAIVCTFPLQFASGDIVRWDTGEVIPGTEGITPGSGVALDRLDLEFADLENVDLTAATFVSSNLSKADLDFSTLASADFTNSTISGAQLLTSLSHSSTHPPDISRHTWAR